MGDPIYDEEFHDEEFNDESIFHKYNINKPIFHDPIFEELIFDKDEEHTKIFLSPMINQSDGGDTIFVDVSYLFEVELSILEFIKIVILHSHHLRMRRIRGRILSNPRRMMRAEFCVPICRSNFRGPYLLTRLSDLRVQHIKSKKKTRSLTHHGQFVKIKSQNQFILLRNTSAHLMF